MSAEGTGSTTAAPRRGWLILLPIVLIGLFGGAAAGYVLLTQKLQAAGPLAQRPPIYFALEPGLIVNFDGGGRVRYLQIGIEFQTRDPKAAEAFAQHAAVVRNNLIMLLSEQSYEQLITREGKEALREAALAEVQSVMSELYGDPAVETLYFTNFVMQ
ncbi:MAG TPA: flagellar basal body-associated FliL family protein [Gammaproteobacteria bacterium]